MATGTIQKLMPTDIGVVRSNLLDNWYFVGGGSQQGAGYFPINTKGQTSYSGNAETLDKWFCGNITSAISSGYVTFTNGNSYRDGFSQDLNKEALFGKKLTGTILLSDGNLYTGTVTAPNSNVSSTQYFAFADYNGNTIRLRCQTSVWVFESMIKASSSLSIVAVKLEVGDSQTLAHQVNGAWVLNEVPNWQAEYDRIVGIVVLSPTYDSTIFKDVSAYKNGDVIVVSATINAGKLSSGYNQLSFSIPNVTYAGGCGLSFMTASASDDTKNFYGFVYTTNIQIRASASNSADLKFYFVGITA